MDSVDVRVWENENVDQLLRAWRRSRGESEDGPTEDAPAAAAVGEEASTGTDGGAAPPAAPASGDVEMTE